MAKATENYTKSEKVIMYKILNHWQMLINSGVLEENELKFVINQETFKEFTKGRNRKTNEMEEIIDDIMKKPFHFKDGEIRKCFTPIPSIEVNEATGEFTMELHKECMNYISCKMEKQFYFADLLRIEKLNSPQAVKMYELLESHKNGNKGLLAIKIEDVINIFNISNNYRPTDIKTKVIESSLKVIEKAIVGFKYNIVYFKKGRSWTSMKIRYTLPSLKREKKFFDVAEYLNKVFDKFYESEKIDIDYKKVINQLDKIEDPNGFKKIERELGEDAAGYVELPNTREWLVERIEFGTGECIDEQLENKIMNM